ncbi:MAG TPA: hypothetical protein VK348_09135, partial [Planctomycetota bacterium]|nr:hypothetical protein [Planctomycetota bacterium]
MTSPPADLSALRDLLAAGGGTPVEHMRALAAARHALGHEDSALELELVELQFLRAQAGAGDAETRAALRAASIAVLRHRSRCRLAAAADDTAAPFDLAECEAEAMLLGVDDLRAACAAAIALRCPLLPAGARLQQEADERWAALATEDEDVPLLHKVLLLRGHAAVLRRLAAATAQSGLLRLGRRMDRAADDRELALRVERLLGTRGARLLETGSFVLLLVVLLLIVIDALLPLSAPVVAWLRLVDALICACFLAEFAGKLALVRNKLSWLLRNALTDLLPSIPAVLWLLPAPPMSGAEDVVVVRLVRLFRITWAARYVQALRPLLRTLRLLAFLVRGMDALVDRFAPLLQTDFVFFAPPRRRTAAAAPPREQLLHQALQREHELLAALPPAAAGAAVRERLAQLAAAAAAAPICAL